MPKLRSIEQKIAVTEGFEVTIRHADGRDMRSDKESVPSYPYGNAAKNDFTVANWRAQRFRRAYPGYDVTVWLANRRAAHGVTKLSSVRATYRED